MGVTGLWTVVSPCARPIKIETLNKKRLAVDASIWIYQFLKAVRDKEGNALRNSHVVGFFRRICKLLYIGIKPVFVFDGGAPALKRQTIAGRKARREGRREDAVRTAGKLLALQMQRRAEEEERKRREEAHQPRLQDEEEEIPENVVYADENQMTAQERQQNRKFKKKDQYHLPELDVSLAEMGGPNDPRVMSLEELEEYARQFDTGEDINVYDFSKIDFDSPFFLSLPAGDRYNILNAARLRSRLRMGYSKDQLDTMFPDRMAFSKFQIERVRERNELTQRLMNLDSVSNDFNEGGRVAGEKGREYVLVRNDGVEGGWALGVVSNKDEGERNKPIEVKDMSSPVRVEDNEEFEEDEDFEDVPIEGLNRLPHRPEPSAPRGGQSSVASDLTRQRRAFYKSRRQEAPRRPPRVQQPKTTDPDSLFLADEPEEEEWEDVNVDPTDDLFEDENQAQDEEDAQLQQAIELSLQQDHQPIAEAEEELDDFMEVFHQSKADEPKPFSKGSAQAIARMANNRSSKVVAQFQASSDDEADDIDLRAALAESRRTKHKPTPAKSARALEKPVTAVPPPSTKFSETETPRLGGFHGPLPFEKLDLGSSLLGKKKMQKIAEDSAGGFIRDDGSAQKKKEPTPPPWFSTDIREDLTAQKAVEAEERRKEREFNDEFQFSGPPRLRTQDTQEIIDVDTVQSQPKQVINLDASDDEVEVVSGDGVATVDNELRMGDVADMARAEPPPQQSSDVRDQRMNMEPVSQEEVPPQSDEEPYEWEESDTEARTTVEPAETAGVQPVGGRTRPEPEKSPSPEFEDVEIAGYPATKPPSPPIAMEEDREEAFIPVTGLADQDAHLDDEFPEYEEIYSDPEDEELFRQLATEAEEHARFASSLNHKTPAETTVDYERELKQLRNQQKRDRRDADEVTATMISECQTLLTLFGLPYITAPMEAEAQCAELVRLNLVDGIVTDDSDIFLFGGTRVYKNMFNQAKFVECYLSSDLVAEFNLTRERLIDVAQLLGSDYTEGLPGVGPVTALELLGEFGDLAAFKEWWTAVQNGTRPKQEDQGNPFRRKFRRNATKLFLPPSFPDARVVEAYLHPEVDSDPSQFVWGVPDLDRLRSFLMATIGWSQERTDEVLVPVIRDMNTREKEGTQSNITSFFGGAVGAGAFAPRRRGEGKSKRLESALGRMAGRAGGQELGEGDKDGNDERDGMDGGSGAGAGADESETTAAEQGKGRKRTKRQNVSALSSDSSADDEEYSEPRKKARKGWTANRKKRS